jgi:thiamine-phosphate pyrophosphorylase
MQLILFTSSDKFRSEIYIVLKMFDNGLETLHVKKPNFSKKQLKNYIELIPEKHHNKIILHSHYSLALKYKLKGLHLSKSFRNSNVFYKKYISFIKLIKPQMIFTCTYHNLDQLLNHDKIYSYAFLSPIFNNEGQLNLKFTEEAIKTTISQVNINIYAIGGINSSNYSRVKSMGFNCITLMGSIWYGNDQPFDLFINAKNTISSL